VNSARDRGYLEGRASENARPQGSRALSLQWIGTIRAYGHHDLLTLQSSCIRITRAGVAGHPILGELAGTVKRKRREADRKLVAGCYLSDRRRKVNRRRPHLDTTFDGPPQTRGAVISDRDRAINGKVFRA
jgi:hypothetical protein